MPASEGEQDHTGGRLVPWPTIHPSPTPILFGYLELAGLRRGGPCKAAFLDPQSPLLARACGGGAGLAGPNKHAPRPSRS